jgi:arsenate reductase (thioredoxin)
LVEGLPCRGANNRPLPRPGEHVGLRRRAMRVSELARRVGIAPSAVRWYEDVGVLPPAERRENGYREYRDVDVARLRLVVSLRRLGLGPEDAGRLARLCMEHGEVDRDLLPVLVAQREAIGSRRADLDRLESELLDLEATIAAIGRAEKREARGAMTASPIRVLFVCTGNSARSQIAEALLAEFGGADFEVHSAGTHPRGVNPFAVEVLAEIGIDWGAATSKSIDLFLDQRFDYVITVCDRARETCPVFPGSENTLHWGLDDPAEVIGTDDEKLAAFRRTRQELSLRLRPFVEIARRSAGRARPASIAP